MALERRAAKAVKTTKAKQVIKAAAARKGNYAPRRLLHSKGSIRSVLAELVTGGKVSSKAAEQAMTAIPLEQRAGHPLARKKAAVDPRQWKTIEGVPVHVDFTRRAWLPDDWCQGVKRTAGGNTYTVYMPPTEVRTFYHQWQIEDFLERKLTTADGFQGQLRLAALAREQVPLEDDRVLSLLSKQERAHLVDNSKFHFCVVSARRAQAPDGARDIASVQYAFTSLGVTPTWYVDADSLEAYRALGLRAVVGGKLTPARNMALDDAQKQGKICVQCSDDITQWEYREGEEAKDRTMDAQNKAHRNAQRFVTSPVAAARFVLAKMRGAKEETRPRLGGAYVLGDCSRTWGGEAFSRRHFILGDFFVVDLGSKVRFDERLTLKEDYDFVAQHIHTFGSVMRCNRMTFAAKHYSNVGGAVDNRDGAGVKEQQNMAILFSKWPNAIFPHNTRANEVMLRWPAEGKSAVKEDSGNNAATEKSVANAGLQPGAVLVTTPKVAKSPYIVKRVKKAAGHTVRHALSLKVSNAAGKPCAYLVRDLKYDLACGYVAMREV